MSIEDFRYDVKSFIKQVKEDVGLKEKVRVDVIRDRPLAKAIMGKPDPRIELPTTSTIIEKMGIPENEAVARSKVAILEEICHIAHAQDHTPVVYHCVRSRAEKFLSPDELRLINSKMERFKVEACKHCGEVVSPEFAPFCSNHCQELGPVPSPATPS